MKNIIQQSPSQFLVESKSEPGLMHVVRKVRSQWQCDCTAALHGMNCWHLKAVLECLTADEMQRRWERTRLAAMSEAERREFTAPAMNLLMGRSS